MFRVNNHKIFGVWLAHQVASRAFGGAQNIRPAAGVSRTVWRPVGPERYGRAVRAVIALLLGFEIDGHVREAEEFESVDARPPLRSGCYG